MQASAECSDACNASLCLGMLIGNPVALGQALSVVSPASGIAWSCSSLCSAAGGRPAIEFTGTVLFQDALNLLKGSGDPTRRGFPSIPSVRPTSKPEAAAIEHHAWPPAPCSNRSEALRTCPISPLQWQRGARGQHTACHPPPPAASPASPPRPSGGLCVAGPSLCEQQVGYCRCGLLKCPRHNGGLCPIRHAWAPLWKAHTRGDTALAPAIIPSA